MLESFHPEPAMCLDLSELDSLLTALNSAISELKQDSTDERQSKVCLLSRSAYTEFYSVSELSGLAPDNQRIRLATLLEAAAKALPKGTFKKSVSDRKVDFERYCNALENRDSLDTAVSF